MLQVCHALHAVLTQKLFDIICRNLLQQLSEEDPQRAVVAEAWEVLAEDATIIEGPLTPEAFADLVLGAAGADECLEAFNLLTGGWGRVYFKGKGDGSYEPRAGYVQNDLILHMHYTSYM
jgi:hypothetical protein